MYKYIVGNWNIYKVGDFVCSGFLHVVDFVCGGFLHIVDFVCACLVDFGCRGF